MTKVSKGIVKSILMVMMLIFTMWACSNENVLDSVNRVIDNGGTDIYDFDDGLSNDGRAAALLLFDGTEYGAELYKVTASCLSDKQISPVTLMTTGSGTVFELDVAKYQFTVVGNDAEGNVRCVGTVTLTLEDDRDSVAQISLIEADNSTQIEYTSGSEDGFLFGFVDTLCVGETKNVQLSAGDNWFGFISSSSKTLYLSWITDTAIQRVVLYKDGRSEDSNKVSESDRAETFTFTTESGEHCYYIRMVATQAINECQLTLTDSSNVPTTTTTTIPPVVTTTSTTTTLPPPTTSTTTSTTTTLPPIGSTTSTSTTSTTTTTTTTVVPSEKTDKPAISYSSADGKITMTCVKTGATIYYTTNGLDLSVPWQKDVCWDRPDVYPYREPFTVGVGTTIKAVAIADGYLCSDMAIYSVSPTVTINVDFEEDFSGIRILVAKSLGYSKIHYFRASNTNLYPETSWPGTDMASYDDKDYCYEFVGIDSIEFLITNASANKLYGSDMKISAPGIYRVTSAGCKLEETVSTTTVSTTSTTVNPDPTPTPTFNGIQVQVSKSLANGTWDHIHYWNCSNADTYKATTWPGIPLDSTISDSYYIYNFDGVSSVNLLITNSSGGKLCGNDIVLTKAGCYLITGSGAAESSYISAVPVPPTYSMSSSATLNGSFTITVNSSTALTASTVKIGNVNKTLSAGNNIFKVSDFMSSTGTLSVSGTLTNEAGSVNISGSITIKEAPQVSNDFNNLTIYQVMVSSFQDGDPSRGYSYAYGPSGALTGGDLQGIINAADYIKDLGCNALWMTPIFDSSSGSQNEYLNSTGYFTYDYFNIDPKFGTNDTFRTLVETYHEKGMYVILDGVFGHWGDGGAKPSPKGKTPTRDNGMYKACSYPASLDFFKEVAQYWIKEYKIDGWRLDQCYQVGLGEHGNGNGDNCYTNGHNYWYEIRKAVEDAAAANAAAGETWGTLGYMVGEHWMGDASIIQKGSVDKGNAPGYGLRSCFDFPARYKLVQSLANEESRTKSGLSLGEALSYAFSTSAQKGYVHDEGYYPNLFITNHDLVRFGNLLNWEFNIGTGSGDAYWGRHRVALATLAAYTGPVTIYYGDEWGAIVEGYTGSGSLGAYNDNVARSTGKISGFNTNEQALINYTKKLLTARAENEAMWNGSNATVQSTSDFYVGKKTLSGKTIIYGINNSSSQKTFSASGTVLADNGENGSSVSGSAKVAPYSATFISVK